MARLIECDNCKSTCYDGAAFGWRYVEVIDESGFMAVDESDKTFCSWGCIAKYAEKAEDLWRSRA